MTTTPNPITGTTTDEQRALDLLRTLDGPALWRIFEHDMPTLVRDGKYPELSDAFIEESDDEEEGWRLHCPVCDEPVEPGSLAAVDYAERWTYVDEYLNDRELSLYSDSDSEFGDTVVYLHDGDHPVALPEGWTEHWR